MGLTHQTYRTPHQSSPVPRVGPAPRASPMKTLSASGQIQRQVEYNPPVSSAVSCVWLLRIGRPRGDQVEFQVETTTNSFCLDLGVVAPHQLLTRFLSKQSCDRFILRHCHISERTQPKDLVGALAPYLFWKSLSEMVKWFSETLQPPTCKESFLFPLPVKGS